MSKFNWDDHPVVGEEKTETPVEGGFDWNALPEVEVPNRTLASVIDKENNDQALERPDVSALRAGIVGAGQGATFGFAEELTAPFAAAVAGATGDVKALPGESTWEQYQRMMQMYRDTARDEQVAAQEQQAGAYTTGAVIGGLASPGLGALKAAKALKGAGAGAKAALGAGVKGTMADVGIRSAGGAAVGAGLGGLAGAGEAEGSLEERMPQAIETAKMGAVVGAGLPVAGGLATAGGKVVDEVTKLPLINKSIEAFKRGVGGENLVTETGRRQAADIVREKAGALEDDIKRLKKDAGTRIGDEVESATEAGHVFDVTEDVTPVLEKLDNIIANGSREASDHARSVKAEIKKILKLGDEAEEGMFGVDKGDLPEGIVMPEKAPQSMKITPKQAQDIKQSLRSYDVNFKTTAQQHEAALEAQKLRQMAGGKLDDVTEGLTKANSDFGAMKDALKALNVENSKLPIQTKTKINNIIARMGKDDSTGDNARATMKQVLKYVEEVDPELAAKYSNDLENISGRLKLSGEINKGLQSGLGLGTVQGVTKAGANIAGMAAGKLGGSTLGAIASTTGNFTKAVLGSNPVAKGIGKFETQGAGSVTAARAATEPYKLQRQVASAAENAEPELLKEQANEIRNNHGKQGESLAMILDNMANENKDARRALMFTVMQNQAYRKMLGLMDEEEVK